MADLNDGAMASGLDGACHSMRAVWQTELQLAAALPAVPAPRANWLGAVARTAIVKLSSEKALLSWSTAAVNTLL